MRNDPFGRDANVLQDSGAAGRSSLAHAGPIIAYAPGAARHVGDKQTIRCVVTEHREPRDEFLDVEILLDEAVVEQQLLLNADSLNLVDEKIRYQRVGV